MCSQYKVPLHFIAGINEPEAEQILRDPADEYVERFVEDVDYAKVRQAESVMVHPKEVAYRNEGPTVVLRRMKQAGLSHIFVVDEERRLFGVAEAEDIARLVERNERELRSALLAHAAILVRLPAVRTALHTGHV